MKPALDKQQMNLKQQLQNIAFECKKPELAKESMMAEIKPDLEKTKQNTNCRH